MNRKDFFKKLGAGAVIAVVAPKVLVKEPEPVITRTEPKINDFSDDLHIAYSGHGGFYTEEVTTTI